MLIALTKGKLAIVDDEDFHRVSAYSWCADYNKCTRSFYARTTIKIAGKRKNVYMHRLIMDAKKGEAIDHVDHNTLDNRKSNTKITNTLGNGKNQLLQRRTFSGFIGVTWYKPHGKWVSRVRVDGHLFHLGYFHDKAEAIAAREVANLKYGFHENHGMNLQEE